MAITSAALQTALGTSAMSPQVIRQDLSASGGGTIGTLQRWYVQGAAVVPGRTRWVSTTASDDAATQAVAVLTALRG